MEHQPEIHLENHEEANEISEEAKEIFEDEAKETSCDDLVEKIKEKIGYEFKNPNLLEQAFTHHSYLDQEKTSTASYERLEYIGDAVLSFFMADQHFRSYPDLPPGQLTSLRAANVDKEKLARAALKHQLNTLLRLKKPLLAGQIEEFEEEILNYPDCPGLVNTPKTLSDVVESLVGAIYIDSNSIWTTFEMIKNLLDPMITLETLQTHPKAMLYETCQKIKVEIESRDAWKESGEVEFMVDGEIVGRAKYESKRAVATNRAAYEALVKIITKFNLKNAAYEAWDKLIKKFNLKNVKEMNDDHDQL